MTNYNYPVGAEFNPEAPWRQEENPEREIEVLISITMSKTTKVKVSDYSITDYGKDEDGNYFEDIDYSECDLKSAVESQIFLPSQYHKYIFEDAFPEIIADAENWIVDDFEVIKE